LLIPCVALGALLVPNLALAQDVKHFAPCMHEPTEQDVGAAKGAFQAGNASFDEADYPRAIVYWEDAYRRDCTAHALLLNLARAYELHGNKPQAIVALNTYLERVPDSPDKEKISRRLEVLTKQLEAERAAATPATTRPAEKTTNPPAATASAPPADPAPAAETSSAPTPTARKRPIAPLIVAGVGGTLAIVGGVMYGVARGDLSDAEDKCPDHHCPSDPLTEEANDARARVNLTGAIFVGGIVVAGAGVTWYLLSPTSTRASAARTPKGLIPVFAPRFAGLSYSGAF
jgi:hypothetical protein